MQNFEYSNPTHIVFGKGTISQLSELISKDEKILMTCGGGSIKSNGVYDQVIKALNGYDVIEFWGIEANPRYETCLKAVDICKKENVTFILSVGGGSALDASKFIAAGALYEHSDDLWEILETTGEHVQDMLPIGDVLTIPATGSEANPNAVISKEATDEKLHFATQYSYPQFSILDPETTYSLPIRQVRNGVVDTFVHTCEQYTTSYMKADLHDNMCEAVLKTLVKTGKDVIDNPTDYDLKANLMHSATIALNFSLGCGAPQDWATHKIGHELTAFYGLDHAQTLAVILPGVLEKMKESKEPKLCRFAKEVFGKETSDDCIEAVENFFKSLGMNTRLSEYNIDAEEAGEKVRARFEERNAACGELGNITADVAKEIILMRS